MSGISGILGGIFDFLTGNLSQLTGNIIAIGLSAFALGLGFFAIRYLGRRRQMLHTERMAAMVKGLHYAGVAREVFAKPQTDSRDHLLCGLRWMFGAAGLSGALYGYEQLQAVPDPLNAMRGLLAGIIPALIGLAHLLFSWLCSRRSSTAGTSTGYYRVRTVGRRF